uniref:G domain-containing protein n=1 Tax=Gibberella zeae TaxID=5518 RepID=A0A4E9D681_GIBZA
MRVTGAGKSTFIHHVTGEQVGIGHGLISHTIGVSIYTHRVTPKRCVYLIDTSGFDDTSRSDTEVLKEVAFFFSQLYRKNVQLAGIIYLHRITDNRVSGSALKNLSMFNKLCGESAFGNVVLCTSMWNNLGTVLPEIGNEREQELIATSSFWGAMHAGGSQVARWQGTKESAEAVVDKIIKIHNESGKAMLKIQEELVDGGMSLDETGAGREVQREILEAKAELKKRITQLQKAQEEMIQQSNETLARELASQRKVFEERLAETTEAQETLKISLETLMEQKEAEYEKLLTGAVSEQKQLAAALQEKAAEFQRARLEQLEDEESFQEAQAEFAYEVESLKQKIKDQDNKMEQQKLEAELKAAEDLKAELEKQRIGEEKTAMVNTQKIEQDLKKKERRKQRMRDGTAILGTVAGVASAIAGVATMNPALIGTGASMTAGSMSS